MYYTYVSAHINGSIVGPLVSQEISIIPAVVSKLTAIQAVALLFFAGLVFSTFLLGVQYIVRYRKYHIAQADDRDSLTNPSGMYCAFTELDVKVIVLQSLVPVYR